MLGVANVVIPTMTGDFKALNERAARHDVEQTIAHGFVGTLACSEVAMSLEE
jgi:4-hydroxy-tetrahydrodipicolinate synthase